MIEKTFGAVTVIFDKNSTDAKEQIIKGLCESYDPYTCMIDSLSQERNANLRNLGIIEELINIGVVKAFCKDIDMPSGKRDIILIKGN